MKQFIIIATMFAFSACNLNNTNNIPRTYIPNYGECTCSSELTGNTRPLNAHYGAYDERIIPIPAYGIESYTHNLPRRAVRLPFNYDDYITEMKVENGISDCMIDSMTIYGITMNDYTEMIKSFMNNGYVTVSQHTGINSTFSLSGNELEITSTNAVTGRIERVIVDFAGNYRFKNNNQLRGERVCLHKQYDFSVEFETRYSVEENGAITNVVNTPLFIIYGRTDTTDFEDEILYKTVLTQEEFRKRIFKKLEMNLYFSRSNGRDLAFYLDSRSWQD